MAYFSPVLPNDEFNQTLINRVHPQDWVNPKPASKYNLVVIGAGTAGLVTAAGAAGLGAKVALIERNLMGGDCLNWGCVPSKSIIRSSRLWKDINDAHQYGLNIPEGSQFDFGNVMERMRRIRAEISAHDSVERFSQLGIDIFLGQGEFLGSDSLQVGEQTLKFKKAVIATGARAFVPPIPGLDDTGYLTNESLFTLTEQPHHLLVVGSGPIGAEMAQAFQRLGTEVTLVEMGSRVLPREDPDVSHIITKVFEEEGLDLRLNTSFIKAEKDNEKVSVSLLKDGNENHLNVDQILMAVGRAPNVEGMGLEKVGVQYDPKKGIHINDYGQTTHPSIFAAGDVCMPYQFTHAADAAARIVIRNTLFSFLPKQKFSSLIIPWCTYTDPEVAHVGLSESEADKKGIAIDTFKRALHDVDRAITDSETEGFVKIHVKKGSDRILGATIVARHAGDMINEITLAMSKKVGLGALGSIIHPYPTQAEAIKQTGDAFNRTRLTPRTKRFFGWIFARARK